MKFSKLHGCGNDYVFVDARCAEIGDPADTARLIADRHCGVGSDGLILVEPITPAGIRVEMYNADGSRAPMCGNGVRCAAKFAIEEKLIEEPQRIAIKSEIDCADSDVSTHEGHSFPGVVIKEMIAIGAPIAEPVEVLAVDVQTDSGPRPVVCLSVKGSIDHGAVDMAPASFEMKPADCLAKSDVVIDQPLTIESTDYRVTCVSMGNMHVVVFIDDLSVVDVRRDGAAIESCGWFPNGANVHFTQVESSTRLRIGIWERGSGATQACGSGACAVVAAAMATHRVENVCDVVMPGGSVRVVITERAYLMGPTATAFSGEWTRAVR